LTKALSIREPKAIDEITFITFGFVSTTVMPREENSNGSVENWRANVDDDFRAMDKGLDEIGTAIFGDAAALPLPYHAIFSISAFQAIVPACDNRLSAVTVIKISTMPKICGPTRLSCKTTTPNSDAVTGSTIATIEATAGAV